MIGPDHYLEAQQWLRYAEDLYRNGSDAEVTGAAMLAVAVASVHAQLAGAAAVAELDAFGMADGSATGRTDAHRAEWARVLVHDPDQELAGAQYVAACGVCGCTEDRPCEGGCRWATPDEQVATGMDPMAVGDLCTRCLPTLAPAGKGVTGG